MPETFFEKYKTSEATNTRRVICTPCQFTRDHFFYVQEAGYLKSLRSHLSKRSGLRSYLFMIVLSGEGVVSYTDVFPNRSKKTTSVSAKAGDCFFLDCMAEYTHISSETNPWELLWIHFYGPQADGYYTYFREHNHWHFCSPYLKELISGVAELLKLHEQRDDNTDIRAASQITSLLTLISASPESPAVSASGLTLKLKNIAAYLDAHYTENISLDFLSEHFYISKYYLSREFKKAYGTTIIQYLLMQKITHAKELLRYSESSIEEIAALCGIDDASYFNKVFKKLEGCTASEYRKRW